MRVKSVTLKDFRNYENEHIFFTPNTNIVLGKNAQGKTNLVESLFLLSTTKSFKTTKDSDFIKYGKKVAEVQAVIERSFGDIVLKMQIDLNSGRLLFVNGNKISKTSDMLGNLCIIFFSPDELKICKGGPADRREFIDTDLSQISRAYYNISSRFDKILINRNKLLKTRDFSLISQQIDVWNDQFAYYASKIIITRKKFLQKLQIVANQKLKLLTSNKEDLTIIYDGVSGEDEHSIRDNILSSLNKTLEINIELGFTTVGPQRDEIVFKINNQDVRSFASQGQIRTLVLALKLAELEIFSEQINDKPILVLDDVFSELDIKRQKKLYENIACYQTIITSAVNKVNKNNNYNYIVIESGKLKS